MLSGKEIQIDWIPSASSVTKGVFFPFFVIRPDMMNHIICTGFLSNGYSHVDLVHSSEQLSVVEIKYQVTLDE